MTIGATAFVAEQVAAVLNGEYVEISVRGGGQTIVLDLPAELGEAGCVSGTYGGRFSYYPEGPLGFVNKGTTTGTRPACAVNLTKIGNVGERIEGTFSATVVEASQNPRTIELTSGTFSVERVAFP